MERQRWFLWLFPVLIVLWSVSGFAHRDDLFGKLEIGLAVLYLLGLPFMLRQRRRAIDRTRTPSTAPSRPDRPAHTEMPERKLVQERAGGL